jgi:hypothetical protein
MEYGLDRTGNLDIGAHVVLDERERAAVVQMPDVVQRARDQVVQPHDLMPVLDQPIGEVRAEESRRTGHGDPHQTAFRPRLT